MKIRKPFALKINMFAFLNVLYYTTLLKDGGFFLNFVKFFLEKKELKLHRRFFKFLSKFIKNFLVRFYKILKFEGIRFLVKGKIGVKGNAKKRRFKIFLKKNSLSQKSFKINHNYDLVRTKTGVLGTNLYIFF